MNVIMSLIRTMRRRNEHMKWHPFGKKCNVVIEGYRRGCGSAPCVHLRADIAMSPSEARRVIERLQKAVDYAEGRSAIIKRIERIMKEKSIEVKSFADRYGLD